MPFVERELTLMASRKSMLSFKLNNDFFFLIYFLYVSVNDANYSVEDDIRLGIQVTNPFHLIIYWIRWIQTKISLSLSLSLSLISILGESF